MLAINFQVGRDGFEQASGNGFGERGLIAVRDPLAGCPDRVNRVILRLRRSLPVYPR
jgi:hypothetical protein